MNGDGVVDNADWELCEGLPDCSVCDVNWDGVVDEADLKIIDDEIGSACTGFRPVPLRVWNSKCYCCVHNDPNCCYDPNDPNACADPNFDRNPCQADLGCLPLSQNGVGFADMDGDGRPDAAVWIDLGAGTYRRRLYRNSGTPLTWTEWSLGAFNSATSGYGAHLGDFNDDGYPDYAGSRSGSLILRVNPGDPSTSFTYVTACLGLYGLTGSHETLCWGDMDGDLDLDLFVPAYETVPPDPNDLTGNRLLVNLYQDAHDPNNRFSCPAGPPTVFRFDPNAANEAKLTYYGPDPNDPNYGYRRPEGAQLVDYDYDGDLDLVLSEHIWQNVTMAADTPRFRRLDLNETGLVLRGQADPGGWPEEGCLFADFDMDGDLDLLRVVRIQGDWYINRSRGDGTFMSSEIVGSGYGFGASAADWDNDGDIDFTAGGTFWRNGTVENWAVTAFPQFVQILCLDDDVYQRIEHALPSFADVDVDGDLDCARSAWGSGIPYVKFYRNNLYVGDCGDCDESTRRYVNIRPVRAAPDNGPKGRQRDYTENEFGARVELVTRNDPNELTAGLRRVQFTASSAGYLNQNEYLLHFGLPPDPDPNDPNEDLRFDVYVDFPTRGDEPNEGSGVWRVDWTVNPQLADINLADLYVDCKDPATLGRPITVYRDGRVRFKGTDPNVAPVDPNLARLYTLGGPLRLPAPGAALPGLTSGSVLAGVRFIKEPNSPELRVREFIVDGQLDQTTYGCAYNLVVLDITDPNNPDVVGGLKARTFTDNQRTFIHVPPQDPNDPDFVLPACDGSTTRTYEVRVRVTSYRMNTLPDLTGLSDDPSDPGVTVDKGLRTESSSGKNICTEDMDLGTAATTPVTIRLSRTGN